MRLAKWMKYSTRPKQVIWKHIVVQSGMLFGILIVLRLAQGQMVDPTWYM